SLGLIAGGVAGEIPPRVKSMVDIAHKNSERLVRLINDILDIDKIESGKMEFRLEPLELAPLIERAIQDNQPYAEKLGVHLSFENKPTEFSPHVMGDGDRLLQVLANLLSNAAKFSPRGENVTVTMSYPDDNSQRVR